MYLFEFILFLALVGFAWFLESNFKGYKSCLLSMAKFVTYLLIVLFLLGGISKCASDDSTSDDNSIYRPDDEIYIYAENYVKENLKSPATAEFAGIYDSHTSIIHLGEGKYKVSSYVDSQNSFGAMIRTKFTCTVIIGEEKVRCQDLKFE